MGNLLLDKGTVYLTWAGTIWEAAEVRRRDWADVPAGAFAWLLDSGEGLEYDCRTLLGVTVQTVHEWKRRGLLKYHKLGSRSYLKQADVLAALQGHQRTVKTGKGVPRG